MQRPGLLKLEKPVIETTCWGIGEAVEAPALRSQSEGHSCDATISEVCCAWLYFSSAAI